MASPARRGVVIFIMMVTMMAMAAATAAFHLHFFFFHLGFFLVAAIHFTHAAAAIVFGRAAARYLFQKCKHIEPLFCFRPQPGPVTNVCVRLPFVQRQCAPPPSVRSSF